MKFPLVLILLVAAFNNIYGQAPEFYPDVAPIILKNCTPCHKQDGYAPFKLEEYEDVAKRAKFVKYVVENRIMPPWKADPHYRSFANQKTLSRDEIKKIADWVQAGAPLGKKKLKKKLEVKIQEQKPEKRPDLVLKMSEPFEIKADNKHTYICYKIPFELPSDTFVQAIEFVPGNRLMVHHASYQVLEVAPDIDPFDSPDYFYFSDSVDLIDDRHDYGYFDLISPKYGPPLEHFHSGWLPGTSAQVFPEGIGFYLPKKGVLMIRNLHYSPTSVPQVDQSSINLYFSKSKIERVVQFAAFRPTNLDPEVEHIIPADSIVEHEIIIRMNSDASMLAVNPHMHLLGKSFKVFCILPDRDTLPVVNIPDWDFNWQEFYLFDKPLVVPKGSIIHAKAVFDNTSSNLSNPYNPPREIYFERGDMDETEEMMRLVFLFLPYKNGDENLDLNIQQVLFD